MKLLGVTDGKYFVASVAHYHYVKHGDLMADGGQPGLRYYSGYNRFLGKPVWAEVSESFGELYTKYNNGEDVGVWKIGDNWLNNKPDRAFILEEKDYPNPHSQKWKMHNFIWGTRGKSGNKPLKYINLYTAEEDHLIAILDYLDAIDELNCEAARMIKRILKSRKEP